ncbi:hypothetical protein Baya_14783 [Bagarius yarrelli]|uniref:Uncharacterized protein n=1 Tax=Bagarius yarrelli TaxID=175774 RepID=A0A556VAD1_BAGYA|nr:hypothetical protein Baya_14783 [Bagarius yarrelli]
MMSMLHTPFSSSLSGPVYVYLSLLQLLDVIRRWMERLLCSALRLIAFDMQRKDESRADSWPNALPSPHSPPPRPPPPSPPCSILRDWHLFLYIHGPLCEHMELQYSAKSDELAELELKTPAASRKKNQPLLTEL